MPDRIRIYHPETNEPFDLPVEKATDLRLNHGWLAQPSTKAAQPEESGIGTISSHDEMESWRDSEVGKEAVEAPQPRRSRRKPTFIV
jgi:hypothetical protein